MKYYKYAPEVWSATKCAKAAKCLSRDGLGTPYPFKGYIGCNQHGGYGTFRFNGGIVIGDKWYDGYIRPLPIVAPGFQIVAVVRWGWRIVNTE